MKETRKGAKQESIPRPAETARAAAEETSVEGRIAERAYEIYLDRGQEPGHALDDWIQAEHEISRTC